MSSVTTETAAPPAPNAVEGVARGSALNVVGAAITAVLGFVVVAVVTRGMTKSDAGVVFTATSLFVLVEALARLGADTGIVHHVAGAMARQREAVTDVLLASLLPVLVFGVVCGAGMFALTVPIERLVLGSGHHGGHGLAIVAVLAVSMPFAATYDVMTAATRALGTMRPTVLIERTLRPVIQLLAVLVAVAAGAQPLWVVLAWTGPYLVSAVAMSWWLNQLIRQAGVARWSPDWASSMRPVWTFTGPRAVASVMQLALQRLDIVLVSALLGLPAAAVYTGATRFVVVGQLGNQAVGFSVQPQLRRLLVRERFAEAFTLFQASTTWIVALTWPLYLSAISLAPLLLKLLGPHYGAGEHAAITVTAAMLVASACGLVDIALITVGRPTWNLYNVALGLGLNVAIDLILIPRVGIEGAAIGWAVAIVVCNLVPLYQIHREHGLHPVSGPWLRTMISAVLCFFWLPSIGELVHRAHSIGALVGLGVGVGAYAGLMWQARQSLGLDRLLEGRVSASSWRRASARTTGRRRARRNP